MKPLNILAVHNYYQYPGGEDTVFSLEKTLLQKNGHSVSEFTDNNARIGSLGVLNAAAQTIWSRSSYQRIKKILQETKPDIVHSHNTFLLISPSIYFACAEMSIPVIQTLHNYRLICPNAYLFRNGASCEECVKMAFPFPGIRYACYRDSYSQSAVVAGMLGFHRLMRTWQTKVDRFIALTDFARAKFIQGGLPEDKIVVKPNFVIDVSESSADKLNRYALYVGHLSFEKGIPDLLSAWASLKIPLKIIGDGPLAQTVQETAGKLKHIEYLGSVHHDEVKKLLSQASFLVFPSKLYEGLPMTVIEAFSTGIPVIAAKVGARVELIHDHSTGLLYDPVDASNLASCASWLWQQPEERKKMGREARRDYENKYTPEKNYEMLMDIYKQVLVKKS